MLTIVLSVALTLIGLLLYLLLGDGPARPRVVELARITFAVALLVTLLRYAPGVVIH